MDIQIFKDLSISIFLLLTLAFMIGMPIIYLYNFRDKNKNFHSSVFPGFVLWVGLVLMVASIVYANLFENPAGWIGETLFVTGFVIMIISPIVKIHPNTTRQHH